MESRIGFGIIPADVLVAVNDERVFQNRKWGTIKEHPHEVGGWLTIMRKLLTEAEAAWASTRGDIDALNEIRKIVATGIACMEQHPVINRSPMDFVALQGGHVPHTVNGE
jgi:hypothetical protein